MSAPLFPLGEIVATCGAFDAVPHPQIIDLLRRHVRGDWGCIDPEDAASNAAALAEGNRIMSAYPIDAAKSCAGFGENCVWIITEADRSMTTVLLPDEY